MPVTLADIEEELSRRERQGGVTVEDIDAELSRRSAPEEKAMLPGGEVSQLLSNVLPVVQGLLGGGPKAGAPPPVQAPYPELSPPGMAEGIEAMGANPAIPGMAISAGAQALGGAVGGPIGAAAGGFVGRKVNVGLGLEEPGLLGDVLSVAPAAMRPLLKGGKKVLQFVARHTPGAAASIHEEAIQRASALAQHLKPEELSSIKLAADALDNLGVPLQNLQATVTPLLENERGLVGPLQSKPLLGLAKALDTLMKSHQTEALPLRQVRNNLEEIGVRIGELRLQQGVGMDKSTQMYNGLRAMYKSVLDDFDSLPGDAPKALKDYRTAMRQDFAAQDFAEILAKPSVISTRQVDGLSAINGRKLKEAWESAKDSTYLQESFTPALRKEVDAFVQEMLHLPPLPSPRGVNVGSALAIQRGGLGYAAATALTGDAQLGGVVAGLAAGAPSIIARAAMTASGRSILRAMMKEGHGVTPEGMSFLAAAVRSGQFIQEPGPREITLDSEQRQRLLDTTTRSGAAIPEQ